MRNASILVKLLTAAFSIIFAGVIGLVLLSYGMLSTMNDMENMFYDVNKKKCKLVCEDAKILNEFS